MDTQFAWVDDHAIKGPGGHSVAVLHVRPNGDQEYGNVSFEDQQDAKNFVAWERSKLFPEGKEEILCLSREEFAIRTGYNVNRSWAHEIRHLLEHRNLKPRELFQEFLRLYDKATPEAQSMLRTALYWSIQDLPYFNSLDRAHPIRQLLGISDKYRELMPLVNRMSHLAPPALSYVYDIQSIHKNSELQALGCAEITDIGDENIYVVQDGITYAAKVHDTERFEVGFHDFSMETFENPQGNKPSAMSVRMGM